MTLTSPLRSARPDSVSVCGFMLLKGQSRIVPESAIGPRERALEQKGKIVIRKSHEAGKVQVVCLLT